VALFAQGTVGPATASVMLPARCRGIHVPAMGSEAVAVHKQQVALVASLGGSAGLPLARVPDAEPIAGGTAGRTSGGMGAPLHPTLTVWAPFGTLMMR